MLKELEQMMELSRALAEAAEAGDVDRIVALLKRRKELTERMGNPDPADPDVASGRVADLLKQLVTADGEIEGKIRELMSKLQKAIMAVQGEQNIVRNYLSQSESADPRFVDREG